MCIWIPIEDYEGLYEVSSEGAIRNSRTGRILKPAVNGAGYLTVSLCKDGLATTHALHILVAKHHVPNGNPEVYVVVHHKDEDRLNNHWSNLEWTTQKYNCEASAHKQAKQAFLVSPEGILYSVSNIRRFATLHNLNPSNLNQVTLGKRGSCSGWRLAV